NECDRSSAAAARATARRRRTPAAGPDPAQAERSVADRAAPPPHLRAADALRPDVLRGARGHAARRAELQQQSGAAADLPARRGQLPECLPGVPHAQRARAARAERAAVPRRARAADPIVATML